MERENDDRIGVFVVLQNRSTNFVASHVFDKLEEYREVIETTLKVEDEWKWFKEPPFPNRGPMIVFYRRQTNEDNDYEWIVERLETLNMVFFMTIQILRGDAKPCINSKEDVWSKMKYFALSFLIMLPFISGCGKLTNEDVLKAKAHYESGLEHINQGYTTFMDWRVRKDRGHFQQAENHFQTIIDSYSGNALLRTGTLLSGCDICF